MYIQIVCTRCFLCVYVYECYFLVIISVRMRCCRPFKADRL